MWNLGTWERLPERPLIVRNGIVKPEMDVVGVIESIEYVDLRSGDSIQGLERVMSLFANTGLYSALAFVSTINRIYPIEYDHQRAFQILGRLPPISYDDFVQQDPSFNTKLEVLLRAHSASADNVTLRHTLAQQTMDLLQLQKEMLVGGPPVSRLTIARN